MDRGCSCSLTYQQSPITQPHVDTVALNDNMIAVICLVSWNGEASKLIADHPGKVLDLQAALRTVREELNSDKQSSHVHGSQPQ